MSPTRRRIRDRRRTETPGDHLRRLNQRHEPIAIQPRSDYVPPNEQQPLGPASREWRLPENAPPSQQQPLEGPPSPQWSRLPNPGARHREAPDADAEQRHLQHHDLIMVAPPPQPYYPEQDQRQWQQPYGPMAPGPQPYYPPRNDQLPPMLTDWDVPEPPRPGDYMRDRERRRRRNRREGERFDPEQEEEEYYEDPGMQHPYQEPPRFQEPPRLQEPPMDDPFYRGFESTRPRPVENVPPPFHPTFDRNPMYDENARREPVPATPSQRPSRRSSNRPPPNRENRREDRREARREERREDRRGWRPWEAPPDSRG